MSTSSPWSDNFDDNSISSTKWGTGNTTGTIIETGGELSMDSATNQYCLLTSSGKWTLGGNFEVQVDWNDAIYGANTANRTVAQLKVVANSSNDAFINAEKLSTGTQQYVAWIQVAGVYVVQATVAQTATSGKFRIYRENGDDVYCQYWNGSDWTTLASTLSGFTGAVYVELYQTTPTGGPAISVDFDNFEVMRGLYLRWSRKLNQFSKRRARQRELDPQSPCRQKPRKPYLK